MSEITKYRTCHLCEAMCGVEIILKKNKIKKISGDKKDPFSKGHICPKAIGLKDIHEDPNRLKKPLKKVGKNWIEISWDQAINEVSEKLHQIQEQHGKNAIAIYSGNPSVHNLGTILGAPSILQNYKIKKCIFCNLCRSTSTSFSSCNYVWAFKFITSTRFTQNASLANFRRKSNGF